MSRGRKATEDKMYHKFLISTIVAAFTAFAAHAQSGGSGVGQGTTQTTPGNGNQTTITPGQSGVINTPGTTVTPGPGGQTQVRPPTIQNQNTPNPGLNGNQFNVRTNRFGANRNFNTNLFGASTNRFLGGTNLPPTGFRSGTILSTNQSARSPGIPR